MKSMMNKLKPCPYCKTIWICASVGDYGSDYEEHRYRVECRCGFAWKTITWRKTKQEAIEAWNRRASDESKNPENP